jgi:type I restriction enzyme S subunit
MNIHQFPWETVKLKDLCEVQLGRTPLRRENKYWDGGTNKWLSISDMDQGRYIYDTSEYMTDYAVEDCNVTTIPVGTVLLSFKLSIGKVSINKVPLSTNEAIAALLIKDETKLYRDYLYWVLQVIDLMQNSDNAAKGKTLNKGKIKELDIPLPSLETQKKIAAVLDKANALRQKRRQTIEKLDELTQSVFLDMFTTKEDKNWETVELGDVITIQSGQVDPTEMPYSNMEHVGGTNIESHTGNFLDLKTAEEEGMTSGKYYFDQDYILYSKIRPYLNKVAIPTFEGICSADIYPVKPKNTSTLNKYYLAYLLRSNLFLKYTDKHSSRTNIPKINRKELRGFTFELPPIDLQIKFKDRCKNILILNEKLTSSQRILNNLFNSLLQKAFKGELNFSESNEQLLAAEENEEYVVQ